MKKNGLIKLLSVFTLVIVMQLAANAQVFSGFSAFKELIEYEGQRYLMSEIYDIVSQGSDKLKIDKTIKEIDSNEGFMFVLTSYKFNDKKGVVITSFNSTNFTQTKHQFVNVHLTDKEYDDLYNKFVQLGKKKIEYDEHNLVRFNERLIVDVNNVAGVIYYTLWVDNYSRHTFTTNKWDRAQKRHKKFVEY